MPQIIAFGHRSRMGKDTCAKLLHSQLKLKCGKIKVKTLGFASKLKAMCHDLWGHAGVQNEQYYEDHPEKRTEILPYFGTDVVQVWIDFGNHLRQIAPNTWRDAVLEIEHKCDILIVPDLRFYNEVNGVKSKGGWHYKVHNPNTPYRDSPSDWELEDYTGWDGVLLNDGDMNHLNDLLVDIVDRYEAS